MAILPVERRRVQLFNYSAETHIHIQNGVTIRYKYYDFTSVYTRISDENVSSGTKAVAEFIRIFRS